MLRSLVGSEMCIRDRSGVGLVEFPYLFACFHAVGVVLVFDVHDAQSVSYTHLTLPTILRV